jgi:outer membrane protein assembly factor BamB
MRALSALTLVVAFAVVAAPAADRKGRPSGSRGAWDTNFEHPIAFQLLVGGDTLLVGTARHLFAVDPGSGAQRWRKRDLVVAPEDVIAVPGTSLLLVNDDFGGKFSDRETSLLAIDSRTGDDVWESKVIKGKGMHVVVDQDSGTLVLVTVKDAHGDDNGLFSSVLPGKGLGSGFERKPKVNVLDLSTGKVLWSHDFDVDVLMRPSLEAEITRGGKQKDRPFDLGLYRPPLVDGGQLFVTYKGVTCYDLRTGRKLWRQNYDAREGELALSYADPVVDGDVLYTTGEGRIRAFDRATGKRLWQSNDFGVVPEIFVDDRVIYGQLGGRFYKVKDEEWTWRGSYGAVAIDRATGKQVWKYDSANDSITNLAIVGDRVWLGDEERIVGLDRATGKKVVAERHRFAHRPLIALYNEADQVVLLGDEEAAGFDERGQRAWYARHKPIGPSLWKRFAAGLLMTSGAVFTVASFAAANVKGLLPAVPAPTLRISGLQPRTLYNTRGLLLRTMQRAGRGFWRAGDGLLGVTRFAHLTGTHQYFLTKLEETDQSLAGVNLLTGATDRRIPLPSRTPNIAIDELNGFAFQATGRRLTAFGL